MPWSARPGPRLWLIYFALFKKSFERGSVLVYQTVAQKRRPGPSGLPAGPQVALRRPSAARLGDPGQAESEARPQGGGRPGHLQGHQDPIARRLAMGPTGPK